MYLKYKENYCFFYLVITFYLMVTPLDILRNESFKEIFHPKKKIVIMYSL